MSRSIRGVPSCRPSSLAGSVIRGLEGFAKVVRAAWSDDTRPVVGTDLRSDVETPQQKYVGWMKIESFKSPGLVGRGENEKLAALSSRHPPAVRRFRRTNLQCALAVVLDPLVTVVVDPPAAVVRGSQVVVVRGSQVALVALGDGRGRPVRA